jgi:hypothetical protein
MSLTFEDEVAEKKDEMLKLLDTISLDEIKSAGLSLSFGGKTFKFKDLQVVENEDLEEKMRHEFREKLNAQQQRIREKINTKVNQLLTMHQQKQNELERKERNLAAKYNNAAMMPDITYDHAKKGLMVVRNPGKNDELLWLFRGRYQCKFYLKARAKKVKAIDKTLRRRLVKDIIIRVKTRGNQVLKVSTHNPDASMSAFMHYHKMSNNSDCWGSWRHASNWSNPDDIILIAKDALAVLETINEGSVAKDNPSGLPRLETVKEHLKTITKKMTKEFEQAIGASDTDKVEDVDVWSTTM